MKLRPSLISLVAFAALLLPAVASAQESTVYVVHGIPGQDLLLDPALPVDVFVSGLGCAIDGFEFGDRVGPLEIPAGSYDITISLTEAGSEPCDGTAVLALEGVALVAGANSTIVAHRTATGDPGPGDLLGVGITASVFANDFSTSGRGKARVLAQHTALAPSVDVVISRNYDDPNAPGVTVPGFTNPTADVEAVLSQISAQFRPGAWELALEVDGATVFGPDVINLRPFSTTLIYAVGVFGESFQYLVYTGEGPKPASPRPFNGVRGRLRR